MTWWQHAVTKEESKKKREFENDGKSNTSMNSQCGQGKRQHKTEKRDGWFFSNHTKLRAHQKTNTKRNSFFALVVEGMTNSGNCCSGGNLPTTTIQTIEKKYPNKHKKGMKKGSKWPPRHWHHDEDGHENSLRQNLIEIFIHKYNKNVLPIYEKYLQQK
jgi:hypothetical protein